MISIIIPCYNEKENIGLLIKTINEVLQENKIEGEIIIVDDDSPDGTGEFAIGLKKDYHNLNVIIRKDEMGFSSAVIRGFEEAKGEILLVMDGDFSHPPETIPELIEPIENGDCELVLGSRYIKGGGVKNWPVKRKIISKGATLLAKIVTSVKDPMSGFFALKKDVIEGCELNPKSNKIGLEIVARGNYNDIIEVPYIFQDREQGESKLDRQVMWNYMSQLPTILFAKNSTFKQFFKFCVVGATGVPMNLTVLYSLVEWVHLWYILSAAIAFCVAVTSNYILNKIWTFRDKTTKKAAVVGSYLKFISVSLVGLGINLTILFTLVDFFHIWYIFSQLIGILGAALWNYWGSKTWAFKHSEKIPES